MCVGSHVGHLAQFAFGPCLDFGNKAHGFRCSQTSGVMVNNLWVMVGLGLISLTCLRPIWIYVTRPLVTPVNQLLLLD